MPAAISVTGRNTSTVPSARVALLNAATDHPSATLMSKGTQSVCHPSAAMSRRSRTAAPLMSAGGGTNPAFSSTTNTTGLKAP